MGSLPAHLESPHLEPVRAASVVNVREVEAAAARCGGRFSMIRADGEDPAAMAAVFEDPSTRPEVVCHLAAWAGVRPSIADPLRYVATNVDGTTRLLELCRAHDVRPFGPSASGGKRSFRSSRKPTPSRSVTLPRGPRSAFATPSFTLRKLRFSPSSRSSSAVA